MAYAIPILFDTDKLKLPERKYFFAGAVYPATQADGSPHPNANEPVWCFAFGEKEWASGEIFDDVEELAEGNVARNKPPTGRVNCLTGELIQ